MRAIPTFLMVFITTFPFGLYADTAQDLDIGAMLKLASLTYEGASGKMSFDKGRSVIRGSQLYIVKGLEQRPLVD